MATATQDKATSRKPDLSVSFAGITFKNPVIAASGTFGYGIEFEDIVTLEKLGGFVTKGLSREPMVGNPPPRLFETAAGMLNAIGLQNIGARAFIEEKLPRLAQKKNVKSHFLRLNADGVEVDDFCVSHPNAAAHEHYAEQVVSYLQQELPEWVQGTYSAD